MRNQLRIVFFADTHLGFDYPIRPRVDRRRRGEDFFANFHRVLRYAAHTRPDLVLHGGDLFFRSRVPLKIVDVVYHGLSRFAQNGIPLILVPGNHERGNLPSSLWLSAPNVYVLDRPRTFHVEAPGATLAISGFPFVRDGIRRRFRQLLAETDWASSSAPVKLLCIHQAVEGAQVGPSSYTFRSGDDVVKMAEIPRGFVAVLAGHIHRKQILGQRRSETPVIYPGSIERTSFAEKEEPKGFFEITLAADEAGEWHLQRADFHELPSRPMVDLEIDAASMQSALKTYLIERIASLDENAIVRLRCKGSPAESVGKLLTASFLRTVFPHTMNVQLAAEFFRFPDLATPL
ncbi:MAG: DNA repair exonuclease [Chloroflexi bacterium]|nr:DNA repair exonuclease [Chloroflexota bacterium]